MSVLNTLPAPVIQMGLVEKIVEVQQNQPGVQQSAAQEAVKQELQEARSRVAGLDSAEDGKKIDDREAGGQNAGRHKGRQGGKHAAKDSDDGTPEPDDARTKPWSGHIVNLKI